MGRCVQVQVTAMVEDSDTPMEDMVGLLRELVDEVAVYLDQGQGAVGFPVVVHLDADCGELTAKFTRI